MRLGTAALILPLFLAPGCATTPTAPLPSKAAFTEQVLEPLAAKQAGEHIKHAQANAVHLTAKWKKEHPPGGGIGSLIAGLVGGSVASGLGIPPPLGAAAGQALAGSLRDDPDAALAEMLAWAETRRLPVTAKYLSLFDGRLQESSDGFSVCMGGKERRYARQVGFPRLDDGPGPCEITKISLKD